MKVFARPGRHALRRAIIVVAALAGTVLGGTLTATGAAAAPATGDGYVRLAHLSPDTPDVDVYLDSVSHTIKQQVFPGVGYGTMSPYLALPAGTYTVAMRGSGAPASSPPVLTTLVPVVAGHAYTVAGVGKHANLGLDVIPDDLSNPLDGQAMVRVIQASIKAPSLDVSIQNGGTVATNVPFAQTTSYRSVRAGSLTLEVGAAGTGQRIPLTVRLQADSVYSVLVLDGPHGLTAQLRTDAVSKGPVPAGPVDTGGGGMAHRYELPAAYAGAAALAIALLLLTRRDAPTRWIAHRRGSRMPSRSL